MNSAHVEVTVAPDAVEFPPTFVDSVSTARVVVANASRPSVSLVVTIQPPFAVGEELLELDSGEERWLLVRFEPRASGRHEGRLSIGDTTLTLTGDALQASPCSGSKSCVQEQFAPQTGTCVATQHPDGTACLSPCLQQATCQQGLCVGAAIDCDDANACTVDLCGADGCAHPPLQCPVPSNPCRVATCDPLKGCGSEPVMDGTVCGAGTCRELEVCLAGTCELRTRPHSVCAPSAGGIAVGGGYACAVTAGGGVKCWTLAPVGPGRGLEGDGTPATDVIAVGMHAFHACALQSSGQLWCWGWNAYGQLGDGTKSEQGTTTPVLAKTGGPVLSFAVGDWFTCARLADGRVQCWGAYEGWEPGGGLGPPLPVDVPNASGSAAITAGVRHACVLDGDGGARCWGRNMGYQLGDGTTTYASPAKAVQPVGLAAGVTGIAPATDSTCALQSGKVKCWGTNHGGMLGIPDAGSFAPTPGEVHGLRFPTVQLAGTGWNYCALSTDGTVQCWGYGSPAPAVVLGLPTDIVEIAAGGAHGCARTVSGRIYCWPAGSTSGPPAELPW